MAKPRNQWEEEAREMAERIDRDRELGQQLTFLPDEAAEAADQDAAGDGAGGGRPKGARNKATSQLRDWLAHRGMRMPEDVLTEVAGLRSREDAIALAMQRAERILSWAFDGAHLPNKAPPAATADMRLSTFAQQYTVILRALEAIMPYVAARASADVELHDNRTIIVPAMPSRPADPGHVARDVTPRLAHRMMPADVAETKQNQQVGNSPPDPLDGSRRTAEPSDGKQKENPDERTD